MSDHDATYELVGFVADTVGDEGRLVQVPPVVRHKGQEFAAPGLRWDESSLIAVKESDRHFVSFFREEAHSQIRAGETVWIAGKNFFADVRRDQDALISNLGMSQWKSHTRGQRWQTGSTRAFEEFAVQMSNFFAKRMHKYLFDALEKSMGDAKVAFRIYRSLPIADSRERELNCGLYYLETHDMYSFGLTRHRAVKTRVFRSRRQYDKALEVLRENLLHERLSDGSVTVKRRGSVSVSRLVLAPYFRVEHAANEFPWVFRAETGHTRSASIENTRYTASLNPARLHRDEERGGAHG